MTVDRVGLESQGSDDLRGVALDIVEAGLKALDPFAATVSILRVEGRQLTAGDRTYDLDALRRIYVVGAGKASLRIAEALETVLGDRISGGVVVVRHSEVRTLSRIEVIGADHPIPSGASRVAADRLIALADLAGRDDLVIACVTGGSSALACRPPEGVTLEEKSALHKALLASGATIQEINTVRKHVSLIKGGRLAAAAHPARILNLTVSDVAGDPLEYITDLTVQNDETSEEAVDVLRRFSLWDEIAPSVRDHLLRGSHLPDLSHTDIHTILLVTGEIACQAMGDLARTRGYAPFVLGSNIVGESREIGGLLGILGRESSARGRPFGPPCALLACGGETTVTLCDGTVFGLGGPNQELSIAAGLQIADKRIVLVSLDTDGSDGGTQYAGGIVDGATVHRARVQGLDLRSALSQHRSSAALEILGDAVLTGPTGTNVNDLLAIVIGGPR